MKKTMYVISCDGTATEDLVLSVNKDFKKTLKKLEKKGNPHVVYSLPYGFKLDALEVEVVDENSVVSVGQDASFGDAICACETSDE